jgi:hypothetical protein
MFNVGDLITLKGMRNTKEKPLGIILKIWATDHTEIMWLNEKLSIRYALHKIIDSKKIEVVNSFYDRP